ncbi:hypothetical protein M5K25_002793 [Dendrobium thyrsiflorum]|uniref:Protein kinase domain-containing protein n=1 Tax=Dendrobium thyrsiflorum TaxID=117978 RepID=A0ABD0VNN9_DENTH
MPLTQFLLLLLSFLPLLSFSFQSQSNFLFQLKQSFSGQAISQWNFTADNYCGFYGITCDDDEHRNVVEIDFSSWYLTGTIPSTICTSLPLIRALRLGFNNLHGDLPADLLNCSHLEELNLTHSGIGGTIPDLSPLHTLRLLDLSNNLFCGEFPLSITNLTNLEVVNFNQNPGFNKWLLPEAITKLKKLNTMILSTTFMRGEVPTWIGNMTWLIDLELSGNLLVGRIPTTIGRMKNLQFLELYYNLLEGEIPKELGNLSRLTDIDLSLNKLTGRIPESLWWLPEMKVLQLYNNSLTGPISPVLGNSTSLTMLSLYRNFLSGELPPTLGKFSKMMALDISENQFSGKLPRETCAAGMLLYFLVLDNHFSGELPDNYVRCQSLLRFRVSNNQLNGYVPGKLFGLTHASIIDLSFNKFEGTVDNSIGNAKNLTSLFLQNNQFSGEIPLEISWATNLVKIDLSNNLFYGSIPPEIGYLRQLNQLSLQGNKLNSTIPESISNLKSLHVLNLSNNLFTGEIPSSLCSMLPISLDFSNNHLSGPIPLPLINEGLIHGISGNPGLCIPIHLIHTEPNPPLCPKPKLRRRLKNIWFISFLAILSIFAILLLVKHRLTRKNKFIKHDCLLPSSSFSYDVTSFHKLNFDQHEITTALIDKNIVGLGGSGIVYKIKLSNGEWVAVKKILTRKTKDPSSPLKLHLERELKTEMETLGSIRHKNIVKLYCCLSSLNSKLLVYEYMPNGNLWDALHNHWSFLNWPTKHRIALGIAQGLAYLHHDLLFPIVHRDIKSSNILLDADFEPKIADFGIAKVVQEGAKDNTSINIIAGTYGYLAPEYAYSSKATTKCDVYSFGVVLLELITRKKPIEVEFGGNKDIISWVWSKLANQEGALEVLDKRLSWSPFKEEMIKMLQIALRCTCNLPALRPSMNKVVQLLIELHTTKVDDNRSSFKASNVDSPIKTNNNNFGHD